MTKSKNAWTFVARGLFAVSLLLEGCVVADVVLLPKAERDVGDGNAGMKNGDCAAAIAGYTAAYEHGHGNQWGGFGADALGNIYAGMCTPQRFDLARRWYQRAIDEPNYPYKNNSINGVACIDARDYSPECRQNGPHVAVAASRGGPATAQTPTSAGTTDYVDTGGPAAGYVFCQAQVHGFTAEYTYTEPPGWAGGHQIFTAVFGVPWDGTEWGWAGDPGSFQARYDKDFERWIESQYPINNVGVGCFWSRTRESAENGRSKQIEIMHQSHWRSDPVHYVDYIPHP